MIFFITGGERSGKSRYAQRLALSLCDNPIYIATARRWDDDFEKRIARHQDERNEHWTTIEEEKYIDRLDVNGRVAVVDCITLWLTNFFIDHRNDAEAAFREATEVFSSMRMLNSTFIIVSNEIGMGVHASHTSGRRFVELQGWMNQHIADIADHVMLMVCGIPLTIKGGYHVKN